MLQPAASDESILAKVKQAITSHAQVGGRYGLVETAGGVLSPAPSGTVQADLYRPLRIPALLVGDHKLGGISGTISAFESLYVRGYELSSVILFDDQKWGNYAFLRDLFRKYDIETFPLPKPPPRRNSPRDDELAMTEYYEHVSSIPMVAAFIDLMSNAHTSRISKIASMPALSESVVWHPFRQYGLPQNIIAIDSAYGDHFEAYIAPKVEESPQSSPISPAATQIDSKPLLTPLFDGSASWWTQGFGHGNPDLSLAAAHAAGRYGHVMFANAAHEPALELSHNLLSALSNPRLSRVFYTDNGSTGMEVAVKMALRAACARYAWNKEEKGVEILGIQGSYHGDTIGVMNCSEPSPFNEKVDWYKPTGFWFEPPQVRMHQGIWEIVMPKNLGAAQGDGIRPFREETLTFGRLEDIFNLERRMKDGYADTYRRLIERTLNHLTKDQERRFGALILEPIIMGAGGMVFVDPLFQRTLIEVVRNYKFVSCSQLTTTPTERTDWTGVPVIADEVFTGLYRLGRPSSSSFLCSSPSINNSLGSLDPSIAPDISVHAKLLTGGLLPLAITTASESIFKTFVSERKQDALLHGHSYTAHAVGCAVANKSLKEMRKMSDRGNWNLYQQQWTSETDNKLQLDHGKSYNSVSPHPYSFFSPAFLASLSKHALVSSCWALGTVAAVTVNSSGSSSPSGYASNAAQSLANSLLYPSEGAMREGMGMHCRVLGDVLYVMTSLTTKPETVREIEKTMLSALEG